MMKFSEFQKYLDLYGADLSRWPQHEIRPALDLTQNDQRAGKIFSEAEKLDRMLRYYPPASVNMQALTVKIVRNARGLGVSRGEYSALLNPAYLFIPGCGLMIAAILGFMLGFHAMAETKQATMIDPVFYTQDHIINDSEEAS